jgi:putative transposase
MEGGPNLNIKVGQTGLSKARRKRLSHLRVVRQAPIAANQAWALDFVHDRLMDGRGFRRWR